MLNVIIEPVKMPALERGSRSDREERNGSIETNGAGANRGLRVGWGSWV